MLPEADGQVGGGVWRRDAQVAGTHRAATGLRPIFNPEYKDVVAFVILVVVLLARPQGILSEVATRKEVAA